MTELNYAQSISLLKECFGQPQKLINAHIQALLDLPGPTNDRPLTYISAEVDDIEPLTPAHLVYGRRITSLPHPHDDDPDDPDYNVSAPTMRKQLTNHTRLLQNFQTRWRREYLTALREFHRITGSNNQHVKAGEVILIQDDGPRIHWRLGIVDSLITGNDGLVRAANVRTSNCITSRPITKLYPLEVSAPIVETAISGENTESSTPTPIAPVERPKRAAARKAMSRLLEWTRELSCPPEDVEN